MQALRTYRVGYIGEQRRSTRYVRKACTVVQAVIKANIQSNGNGQISIHWGSSTREQISMKLGIYNYVGGMTTHFYN